MHLEDFCAILMYIAFLFYLSETEYVTLVIKSVMFQFVTTSKDGTISVWKSTDASKVCDIKWDSKTTSKYRVRSCR